MNFYPSLLDTEKSISGTRGIAVFLTMFLAGSFLTFVFLMRVVKIESQQRSILDQMNREIESLDPDFYTGNSRHPHG